MEKRSCSLVRMSRGTEGGALGDVERGVLGALVGHAVGLVDHEEVVAVGVADRLDGGLAEERPGDGERQDHHDQDAQEEEQEVLELHAPAGLLERLEEELHRRPPDPLELLAVEQVDDDRDRASQREPEQGGVEESHLRRHHRVTEITERKTALWPPRTPCLGGVLHVSFPRMERRPARYFVSSTSRSWSVEIRT